MKKDVIKKFYDNHETYNKRRTKGEFRNDYIDEIDLWKNKYLSSVLPKELTFNRILDVGCGTGDLLARFPVETPHSNRCGIDISEKNIEYAKRKYPEIDWHCGTIDDASFDHRFDLIILSDILEHVENDFGFLEKASNLSKYLVLNIPMEKCLANRNRNYGLSDPAGHLRAYDISDVFHLVRKANTKIISFRTETILLEPFWQRKYTRDCHKYFKKHDFVHGFVRIPFITHILTKCTAKLFSSNFFGFVQKE